MKLMYTKFARITISFFFDFLYVERGANRRQSENAGVRSASGFTTMEASSSGTGNRRRPGSRSQRMGSSGSLTTNFDGRTSARREDTSNRSGPQLIGGTGSRNSMDSAHRVASNAGSTFGGDWSANGSGQSGIQSAINRNIRNFGNIIRTRCPLLFGLAVSNSGSGSDGSQNSRRSSGSSRDSSTASGEPSSKTSFGTFGF